MRVMKVNVMPNFAFDLSFLLACLLHVSRLSLMLLHN